MASLGAGVAQGPPTERLGLEQRFGGGAERRMGVGVQPVCGSRRRPGRLETGQLAQGKASSSEQDLKDPRFSLGPGKRLAWGAGWGRVEEAGRWLWGCCAPRHRVGGAGSGWAGRQQRRALASPSSGLRWSRQPTGRPPIPHSTPPSPAGARAKGDATGGAPSFCQDALARLASTLIL